MRIAAGSPGPACRPSGYWPRLGVSRGTLRKALADLEVEGLIWRHVGRGTFVGNRPVEARCRIWAKVTRRTNPAGVMEARLSLEPELARLAALHATPADLDELAKCVRQSREAGDWQFQYWDNRLHRAVAEATANVVLLALFDSLNTIRRTVTWGRLRRFAPRPDPSHHSFAEHDRIIGAIVDRDPGAASAAMRAHLRSVRDHLLLSAELAHAEASRVAPNARQASPPRRAAARRCPHRPAGRGRETVRIQHSVSKLSSSIRWSFGSARPSSCPCSRAAAAHCRSGWRAKPATRPPCEPPRPARRAGR